MDSLARFEKILALLEANPAGLTGRSLAELCGVPWRVMRDDLFTIYYSGQNVPIYRENDALTADDLDTVHNARSVDFSEENFNDSDEEVFEPDERWYIVPRKGNKPVHLTGEDHLNLIHVLDFQPGNSGVSQSIKEKLLGTGAELLNLFYVKGNMEPLPEEPALLLKLEAAMLQRQSMEVRFNGKTITLDPLGLIYYTRLRAWYLAAQHDTLIKTYRLSRLEDVRLSRRRYRYPENFDLKTWFKARWGMEFGEEYKVKVRFADRAQTCAKVRKDVAHREASLYEENGYLIFEDKIIGKNEFLAWVMGFGSAAEILEPRELRLEMKERLQKALVRYSPLE